MKTIIDILIPAGIIGIMGLLFGAVMAITGRLFAVKQDPTRDAVRDALPGANCGGCGFAGCDAYAQAVAEGNAEPNKCPVGGEQTAEVIGHIVGRTVEKVEDRVALVRCQGDTESCGIRFQYDGPKTCRAASLAAMGDKSCQFACLGYGDCAAVCPNDAISIVGGVARVDTKKCSGCGICARECPNGLIEIFPDVSRTVVTCSSTERGASAKNKCKNACIGCKKCEKACSAGAIRVIENLARIDYGKCTNCGECAKVCLAGCIRIADFSGVHR